MNEFYVYHVVTERPMSIGQHIIFDETHHNGVYQRVMDKLTIVEEIYADPAKYAETQFEHFVSVALRELALEEVRKEKYPEYPSRLSCLYTSETLEEAIRWGDYFVSLGRPTYQIVRLKVVGNKFVGNANNCFAGTADRKQNFSLAGKYWENKIEDNEPPVYEMLIDGEIEVVEVVKEY